MNTTHTPSPWKYDENLGCRPIKGGKSGISRQAQYKEIAFTTGLNDDDEDRANARLMSAAPDMYEALLLALDEIRECDDTSGVRAKITAALAKAGG